MAKLTKAFIDNEARLPNGAGQLIYRDEELIGFALRVTSRSKSFIVEKRVNGKNFRVTIGKCEALSVREAREKARLLLDQMSRGIAPSNDQTSKLASDITLGEAYQKYLSVRPLSQQTIKLYRYSMENCLSDWLDLPFLAITKDMAEERHRKLSIMPTRLGTSGHARANNALRTLKAVLNFASERYSTDGEPLIRSNPVDRITVNKQWHKKNVRGGFVPDEKIRAFCAAIIENATTVFRDYLFFLLFTGMRKTEAASLRWNDIDWSRRVIKVPKEITKMKRAYTMPLSDFLYRLLEKRQSESVASEWVFPSPRDPQLHINNSTSVLPELRSACGYHFQTHDLRRTFITMGANLEVPFHVLKMLVNHKLEKEMTERYMIVDIETQRVWMQKISDRFVALVGEEIVGVVCYGPATVEHQLKFGL